MQDMEYKILIEPKARLFNLHLNELKTYKDLIFLFVRRDFVSLYKQTILGPAWAVIQPLLTTIIFTIIFGNIAGLSANGVPSFIFYFSGTIIWTYYSNCLSITSNTFITNRQIFGKVYFPRIVMPISTTISQLINFGIQFVFMILFLIYFLITDAGGKPNIYVILTPLLVLQIAILGLGFGVIISSLTTKYRDLAMLVTFGLELWKYASPIAYDMFGMKALSLKGSYHILYMLNPVTPIVNIFRYAFLSIGCIEWNFYIISWFTTIVILLIGIILFNRIEKTFMDTI